VLVARKTKPAVPPQSGLAVTSTTTQHCPCRHVCTSGTIAHLPSTTLIKSVRARCRQPVSPPSTVFPRSIPALQSSARRSADLLKTHLQGPVDTHRIMGRGPKQPTKENRPLAWPAGRSRYTHNNTACCGHSIGSQTNTSHRPHARRSAPDGEVVLQFTRIASARVLT